MAIKQLAYAMKEDAVYLHPFGSEDKEGNVEKTIVAVSPVQTFLSVPESTFAAMRKETHKMPNEKSERVMALAFAPTESFLCLKGSGKPKTLSFKCREEGRILMPDEVMIDDESIPEFLKSGGALYTELGGHSGPFCLQALSRGIKVFRIPTFRLAKHLNGQMEDEDSGTIDEREKKQTANRKKRAKRILELSQSNPELFYELQSVDEPVVRIGALIYTYLGVQQDLRIKAQQRRLAMQFKLGWLPDTFNVKRLQSIRELLANPKDIEYYEKLEAECLAGINKELVNVLIWNRFLKDIKGIGPSLAGRIIAGVEDIRRFPELPGFRAYLGLSVTADGKAARFRRKKEGEEDSEPKYSPSMKQALYLFGDQILRQGEKNPYNIIYARKKAYYAERDPDDKPIVHHRRALWVATSYFARDLYENWWRIQSGEETYKPDYTNWQPGKRE